MSSPVSSEYRSCILHLRRIANPGIAYSPKTRMSVCGRKPAKRITRFDNSRSTLRLIASASGLVHRSSTDILQERSGDCRVPGGFARCDHAPYTPGLSDNFDHELLLRAVRKHITCKWALLYIERWLKASTVKEDGTTIERNRGTRQGGVASPILANLLMHYTSDLWMARTHRDLPCVDMRMMAWCTVGQSRKQRPSRLSLTTD